jgi:muconolactone delta-isomerase
MRYLVSINFDPGQDAERAALLPAEQAAVGNLMKEGVVEAGYLSADRSRSWMVLQVDSRERAHTIMASLPFHPFMTLEYTPLFDVQPGQPRREGQGAAS